MKNLNKLTREQFEKKLFKKFKFIFRDHKLSKSSNGMGGVISNGGGISTGRGWYNLIWKLSYTVNGLLKKTSKINHINYKCCYRVVRKNSVEVSKGLFSSRYLWLVKLFTKIFHKYKYIDFGFRVVQVKEKFGLLRFYVSQENGIDESIVKVINNYQYESENTCELCGRVTKESNLKGSLKQIYNICDYCWATSDKNKRPKDLIWQ